MSVTVQNISKVYTVGDEEIPVLQSVSFQIDQGETLAIVGESGSGKTTLLNILGCLDFPTSGIVMYGESCPAEFSRRKLAQFRRDYIGFIFQDSHLLPQLTALENVLLPTMAEGRPLKTDLEFARTLLSDLGLADRLGYLPSMLSGGQKQRVAIARALIKRPSLILADEPTGNLDPRTAAATLDAILSLHRQYGSRLIMATHSRLAAERMGRIGVLEEGRLILTDNTEAAADNSDPFNRSGESAGSYSRATAAISAQPLSLGWEEPSTSGSDDSATLDEADIETSWEDEFAPERTDRVRRGRARRRSERGAE